MTHDPIADDLHLARAAVATAEDTAGVVAEVGAVLLAAGRAVDTVADTAEAWAADAADRLVAVLAGMAGNAADPVEAHAAVGLDTIAGDGLIVPMIAR